MRRLILLLALLALFALALPAAAPAEPGAQASKRKNCGVLKGMGGKYKFRVVALRGVSCRGARKVAKRYDRVRPLPRGWACGLAHNEPKRLFSCGKGGTRGDLRKWPHALVAIRVRG